MCLNVLYSSSDAYAMMCGVSIVSLLENNQSIYVNIYIFDDGISEQNKMNIRTITAQYNCSLTLFDMNVYRTNFLDLGIPLWQGGMATYYKIFMGSILSDEMESVIYMDCDTIICGELKSYIHEIKASKNKYAVYGVLDFLPLYYKNRSGFNESCNYINCGVLYIDLNMWRLYNCEKKIINNIKTYQTKYPFVDQDLINTTLQAEIGILPPMYNYLSIISLFTPKQLLSILEYGTSDFYSENELELASQQPKVIHFSGSIVGRPWFNGYTNRLTQMWDYYLSKSPWRGYVKMKDKRSFLKRSLKNMYIIMPNCIFVYVLKILYRLIKPK